MDLWQVASWVGGGLTTLLTLNFMIFWKILQDTKLNINERINKVDNRTIEIYKYVDETFSRKDTHHIEYGHVLETVNRINEKLDKFYEEFRTKVK